IRDFHVTGVQTCALPIYADGSVTSTDQFAMLYERTLYEGKQDETAQSGSGVGGEKFEYLMKVGEEKMNNGQLDRCLVVSTGFDRSEERRVGKECRSGWSR